MTWIPRRSGSLLDRTLRVDAARNGWRIHRALEGALGRADVVHVHSNGLLAELAALLAQRRGRPVVLTLYGTEIWHYRPKRMTLDLFTRAYQAAAWVTFYSDRLMAQGTRARPDAPEHANHLSGGRFAIRVA